MRFGCLKVKNLALRIDLVNRRRVVYSRAYGILNCVGIAAFNKSANNNKLTSKLCCSNALKKGQTCDIISFR